MRNASKYIWIGYTAARSNLAYAGEVLSRLLFMSVILYIFMRLWSAVYSGSASSMIGGFTLPQMLWYLMVTESIVLSAPRVWTEVDTDVRTGRMAVQLIHPLSYACSHLARSMGERIVRFAINFLAGAIIALVLVGPIPLSAVGLVMFLVALPMAFLLDFLGMFLVGLCAFWIESTAGIALIYSRLTMMLGGMLLPVEVYPESIQPVIRILPFASMISAPGRIFVSPGVDQLKAAMAAQSAGILVLAGLVGMVQSMALRRLFANGG